MSLSRRSIILGSAATLFLPAAARAGGTDISAQITDTLVTPLSTGASSIALIFDLASWPRGWVYIVRHYCPVGVEMHSQGFSILPHPDGPAQNANIRNTIRLTNMRNMYGLNGEQGFSWYIRNDGESVGPVRLELSFVARSIL